MQPTFIHLHLHSEYSLVDGIVRVKELPEAAKEASMPAVAITDHNNLFAMVKFYKGAIAKGIKPIIGADVLLQHPDDENIFRCVLLCQNETGYKNLSRLISKSYLEGQSSGEAIIQSTWLEEFHDGLIVLSGATEGDIAHALINENAAQAENHLKNWLNLFGNRFYIELQRTGKEHEEKYIHAAVELALKHRVPVVATNDVRFLKQEDFHAHEARVCIHDGYVLTANDRPRKYTQEQYLKTPDEMATLFKDIPEALKNTVEIAKRCNLQLEFGKNYLPDFPVPEGMTVEKFLENESEKGLHARLQNVPSKQHQTYHNRLHEELEVIKTMGFPGYFLIVADFIRWAKEHDIPVGPGRGSGAGSLVAYALGITDLDPLIYDLLFERFLNPERVSMPDFDIDFCMENRDRVIEYVAEKYGRESVSQIITYGTMAARAVVRDVGRVLDHPYGFVDKIAKLIPMQIGMTLKDAMREEEQLLELYNEEEDVNAIINLALKLEGIPRNAGKHAGGVVIAPTALTEFSPLYCEPDGESVVTQFDKDDVETIGLVKFDFLGLRTLTIIDWAVKTINKRRTQNNETPININAINLDDDKTYELLKACETTAVFQLESRGMKDLIKRLEPDDFEEIVALVALFRPGPLQSGMVDDFINRKHGRAKVEYPHPALEPILKPTYGVILYQEQVMQIAQVLGGYSLGGADLLRRAMGKKKPEEMAKHRAIFVAGATDKDVDAHLANMIFDLMEKFAGYGFNKSHSAAYALLSYQTAWLKTHYPAEFMAAVLSSDMDNTDKVVLFFDDCKRQKLTMVPPDINHSEYQFTVNDKQEIVYGLGAIKGVGQAAVESFLQARKNGAYKNLFEFCKRNDSRKVNRKTLEALIRSGAMDSFNMNRATLFASVDAALATAEQHARDQERGQNDLFASTPIEEDMTVRYLETPNWDDEVRLQGEKETLGLYLSGHPLEKYRAELNHIIDCNLKDVQPKGKDLVRVAGFMMGLRVMTTKSGKRMAFVSLDDTTAKMDITIFSDNFITYRELLVKDTLLVIEGEVSHDDFTGGYKMLAQRIMTLDDARETYAKEIRLKLKNQNLNPDVVHALTGILTPHKQGRCPVIIEYQTNDTKADLALGNDWRVRPSNELIHHLKETYGLEYVEVVY